jgi:hypothetical protein
MHRTLFGLAILLLAVISPQAHGQSLLPPKAGEPIVITKIDDILKWIPKDTIPTKRGVPWTQPQMDIVNAILKKKLESNSYILKLSAPVSDIPTWNGKLQIFSEVPNREGYHIRLFWVFKDDAKPQLAKLKIGDKVSLMGPLAGVKYENLWNAFTLSIATSDTTLVK